MQSFQSKNIKLFSLQTIYTYSMVAFLYCIPIYYIYLFLCGAVHLYLLLMLLKAYSPPDSFSSLGLVLVREDEGCVYRPLPLYEEGICL